MSATRPTATGDLRRTPIVQLLLYALDRHLDGTLVLESPDATKQAIVFLGGAPAKAQVVQPVPRIGELLKEAKLLTDAQIEEVLARAGAEGKRFGEACVSAGLVRPRELLEAMRRQVIAKVTTLLSLPEESVYGYYAGVDFLKASGVGPTRVKPLPLLWSVLREGFDARHALPALDRLRKTRLKLHFDAPIGRFKLTREERAVVDLLRAQPQTLSELCEAGVGTVALVERVVYALAMTRQFDFGLNSHAPLGLEEAPSSSRLPVLPRRDEDPGRRVPTPASSPPAMAGSQAPPEVRSLTPKERRISSYPPPSRSGPPVSGDQSPAVVAFEQEVLRLSKQDGKTYYEFLGVQRNATQAEIESAFLLLAKRWHPDRQSAQTQHLAAAVTRIFAKMTEAHQVLGDPERRSEYDQELDDEPNEEEQAQVAAVLRAASAFQRAEILFKKKNYAAAERDAREAVEADPKQADYIALLAWVRAHQPQDDYSELIAQLDRAVTFEPTNQRALYYRGQLHKRGGKMNRAAADFRRVLDLNPDHIEAQRELRLYEMRRSDPLKKKDEKKTSLLGKWFKK